MSLLQSSCLNKKALACNSLTITLRRKLHGAFYSCSHLTPPHVLYRIIFTVLPRVPVIICSKQDVFIPKPRQKKKRFLVHFENESCSHLLLLRSQLLMGMDRLIILSDIYSIKNSTIYIMLYLNNFIDFYVKICFKKIYVNGYVKVWSTWSAAMLTASSVQKK